MKKFIIASTVLVAAVVLGAASARATVLASDNFDAYSNGPLVGQAGSTWVAYSGATANNVLNQQDVVTSANSQDVGLPFSSAQGAGTIVYAGFDVNQTTMTGPTTSYFAHFKDSTTFNFFGRTYVSNSSPGVVMFGIANGSSQVGIPFTTGVATGTWNRLVISFDQTGASAVSKLYLGPVNDSNIADFQVITASDASFPTNFNIAQFALRQASASTGAGTELLDNVLVGQSFGEVVVPEPSTVLLVGAGMLGLFAARRRRS
jgi:hypothetical protein